MTVMTVKQLVPGTLCKIVEIVPTGGKAPHSIWGRRYTVFAGPGKRQLDKFDIDYINRTDIIMFISQWNETYAEVFVPMENSMQSFQVTLSRCALRFSRIC